VHDEERAAVASAALNARAFTIGRDIFFAPGRCDPHSESGGQLLRHELTHVVQQGHARIADPDQIPVGDRATAAEGEARAVSGDPRRVSPASGSVGPAAVAQCLERPDTQPPAST
jgi:hypothetical protein